MSDRNKQSQSSDAQSSADRIKRTTKPPIPSFRPKMSDTTNPPRAADKLKRRDKVDKDDKTKSYASKKDLGAKAEDLVFETLAKTVEEKGKENGHPKEDPIRKIEQKLAASKPEPENGNHMPADEPLPATTTSFADKTEGFRDTVTDDAKETALSDEKESADSYRAPVPTPRPAYTPLTPSPLAQPKAQQPTAQNDNSSAMNAILRGMEILHEDKDTEENGEEIRRLDTQLDHLNECLDKFEVKIRENHDRIQGQLKEQRATRLQRRASFQQRLEQSKSEDGDFSSEVAKMLNRCRQNRNSVQYDPDVQNVLEQARSANGASGTQ